MPLHQICGNRASISTPPRPRSSTHIKILLETQNTQKRQKKKQISINTQYWVHRKPFRLAYTPMS